MKTTHKLNVYRVQRYELEVPGTTLDTTREIWGNARAMVTDDLPSTELSADEAVVIAGHSMDAKFGVVSYGELDLACQSCGLVVTTAEAGDSLSSVLRTFTEHTHACLPMPEFNPDPLTCLECGHPEHQHRAATSTTLEDHRHAAEFYRTCAGDLGVQHRLYPEAFPTPGPYVFTACSAYFMPVCESPDRPEGCWHVQDNGGRHLTPDEGFESEREAREWAAEYEPDTI